MDKAVSRTHARAHPRSTRVYTLGNEHVTEYKYGGRGRAMERGMKFYIAVHGKSISTDDDGYVNLEFDGTPANPSKNKYIPFLEYL